MEKINKPAEEDKISTLGGKKDDKDKNSDDKDKNDKDKKENEQKSDEDKKPLPPAKLPAKIKQLMSDDRQLQMKMIENGTRELNKRKSRKSKDW